METMASSDRRHAAAAATEPTSTTAAGAVVSDIVVVGCTLCGLCRLNGADADETSCSYSSDCDSCSRCQNPRFFSCPALPPPPSPSIEKARSPDASASSSSSMPMYGFTAAGIRVSLFVCNTSKYTVPASFRSRPHVYRAIVADYLRFRYLWLGAAGANRKQRGAFEETVRLAERFVSAGYEVGKGICFHYGFGGFDHDYVAAERIYLQAATNTENDHIAQYQLADIYIRGGECGGKARGCCSSPHTGVVAKDEVKAVALLQQALVTDDVIVMAELGRILEHGVETSREGVFAVPKDEARAWMLFESVRQRDVNDEESHHIIQLAGMYEDGCGCPVDLSYAERNARATKLYYKAAARENVFARFQLAKLLASGRCTLDEITPPSSSSSSSSSARKDDDIATRTKTTVLSLLQWVESNTGSAAMFIELGRLYGFGYCDTEKAVAKLAAATKQKHTPASTNNKVPLGGGIVPDYYAAFRCYVRAVRQCNYGAPERIMKAAQQSLLELVASGLLSEDDVNYLTGKPQRVKDDVEHPVSTNRDSPNDAPNRYDLAIQALQFAAMGLDVDEPVPPRPAARAGAGARTPALPAAATSDASVTWRVAI